MRDRLLNWIARCVWRAPFLILGFAVVLAIASAWYAHRNLQINADTNDLISPKRPFMRQFRGFLQEFGDTEYIYAVVANNGNQQRTEACVDALTVELKRITSIPGVYSGVTPPEQLRIASRAMSEQELAGFVEPADAFAVLRDGDPDRVIQQAIARLDQLVSEGAKMSEEDQRRIGGAAVFVLNIIAAAREGSPSAKEMAFLLGTERKTEYFKSSSGQLYFVTIIPEKNYSTLDGLKEPLQLIRAGIARVQHEFPDVEIGLTGKPVLQADEMQTSDADMTKAAIVAFILCSILLMVMYRSVWRPLLSVIAFACAAAWTYGFATLAVGQLNLLSIVFILVLVGIGLDYGVHIISRYREFRARGDVRSSITGAITTAGRGNITGSFASAIVFFMAFFTNFRGLQELGLIAGGGLLLCMISMTVVLPALLVIANRWRRGARQADGLEVEHPEDVAPGMLRSIIAHPQFVVIAALVVTLGCSVGAARVHFEQNLLKLQAPGLDSVKWERRIADDSASNTWFGVVIADAIEQIPDIATRALARPTIGEVHSVLDVVQLPTPPREELRKRLHAPPSAAMPNPEAPKAWGRDALEHMVKRLKLMAFGARSQAPEEADRLTRIATDIDALADQWRKSEAEIRRRIEQDIRSVGASTAAIIEGDSLGLREALPDGVRDQFMSKGGRFAVMLHPGSNVWEFEPMKAFVADMRAVNSNVTGVPITTYESLLDMRHAFGVMSILAVIVITGIVLIDFRRPLFIVLALLPMGMVALWTTEAMGLLNISFNLANFFSVPILIGLSVNGSVYVLHRYREGGPTRFNLGATRRAVILTALNTLIGFGALMAARHRGLRSLGEVMAIGSTACLVASVIVLPAILAWLESLRPPSRQGST